MRRTSAYYKDSEDGVLFSSLGSVGDKCVVSCQGIVGQLGQWRVLPVKDPLHFIQQEQRMRRGEGYRKLDMFPGNMVVQFSAEILDQDLYLAYESVFLEIINDALFWKGLGCISGSGSSRRCMNIFVEAIDEELAIEAIITHLAARNALQGVTVGYHDPNMRSYRSRYDRRELQTYRVAYSDSAGRFSLLGPKDRKRIDNQ